jgi:hypothetical protein
LAEVPPSTLCEINFNQLTAENKLAVMQYINRLHAKETPLSIDDNVAPRPSFQHGFFELNPEAQISSNGASSTSTPSCIRSTFLPPQEAFPQQEAGSPQQVSPSTSRTKKRKQLEAGPGHYSTF